MKLSQHYATTVDKKVNFMANRYQECLYEDLLMQNNITDCYMVNFSTLTNYMRGFTGETVFLKMLNGRKK